LGQITGHLWQHFLVHFAGSWAQMSWLELALSLCPVTPFVPTHFYFVAHVPFAHSSAVTETFPPVCHGARLRATIVLSVH